MESDQTHVAKVVAVVNAATPGSYTEVDIPFQMNF